MKITDNVIMDILPVYLAEEVSSDTRDLVEAYMREHPEFDPDAKKLDTQLLLLQTSHPKVNQEKQVFARVKRILRLRSILFGVALFLTMMPLSISGSSERGVTWTMLGEAPMLAAVFWGAAVLLWGAFYWTHYVLREN